MNDVVYIVTMSDKEHDPDSLLRGAIVSVHWSAEDAIKSKEHHERHDAKLKQRAKEDGIELDKNFYYVTSHMVWKDYIYD